MSRLAAAVLVVVAAFALSAAQNAPKPEPAPRFPFGGSKSQLPFDVVEIDGKQAWQIVGRGNVRVEELIAGLATATDLRITYDATGSALSKMSVPYVGSDTGTTVTNAELADFVSELISAADLTLVGHSTGRARVVRLGDGPAYARPVTAEELATLPLTEWVSLTRTGLSPNYFPDRLFDQFTRAGVLVRVDSGVFSASGRVEQMRNVNTILNNVASAGSDGKTVKTYGPFDGIAASDAARVLNELFAGNSTTVDDLEGKGYRVRSEARRDVNVSVLPSGTRLQVRATEADHRLVKAALDTMK